VWRGAALYWSSAFMLKSSHVDLTKKFATLALISVTLINLLWSVPKISFCTRSGIWLSSPVCPLLWSPRFKLDSPLHHLYFRFFTEFLLFVGYYYVIKSSVRWNDWLEEVSWVMDSRNLSIQRRGGGRKFINASVVEKHYDHRSLGAIGRWYIVFRRLERGVTAIDFSQG